MGRDNSPKERHRKQLERKQSLRASYDRILIVSEGSKTEPNYFSEIRSFHHLHATNVQVWPSTSGTASIQVVNHARNLFEDGDKQKKIQPRAFEQVYAVFDRDDHTTYYDALKHAETLNNKLRNDERNLVIFKAIPSVPSFELWLLLHFEDIQAPLHRNEVLQRVKKHIPGYEKGFEDAFKITRKLLSVATQRAERLAKKFTAYNDPEPYTAVVDLVKLLTTLTS